MGKGTKLIMWTLMKKIRGGGYLVPFYLKSLAHFTNVNCPTVVSHRGI